MKMRTKMAIMLMIPILTLLFFVQSEIRRSINSVAETDKARNLIHFTIKFSTMVHELQKERGQSIGYLGSGGAKFATVLSAQHKLSDVKIDELKSFLKDFDTSIFGASFPTKFESVLNDLAQIEQKRQAILKQEISFKETLDYYTVSLNGQFLDLIVELAASSYIKQSRMFNAYINFFQSKELAGIERAVLSNVFARGQFDKGMYELFTDLVNSQATYTKIFLTQANEEHKHLLMEMMSDPVIAEVARMRSIIYTKRELIDEINSIIGYGGLIHNFKNYLLRGEEKYIDAFNQNFQDVSKVLNGYLKQTHLPDSIRQDVVRLNETFASYREGLDTAIKMRAEGKNAEIIDVVVKVNDDLKLNALKQTNTSGFDIDPVHWFELQTKKINLLKKVEDKLSQDLLANTEDMSTKASGEFNRTLLLTLITLSITVFVVIFFSRSIFKQVGDDPAHIQKIARQVADGDLDVPIMGKTGIAASIKQMVDTFNDAAHQANIISSGDYTADIKPRSGKDKLGIALQTMTGVLRDASNQADVISSGDYTVNIKPRSDKDRLGVALQKMTEILRNISQVAERIATGDTSIKVESQGKNDLLAKSINQMVDTLNDASSQADMISSGDYTADIKPRSDKDRLGVALQKMTDQLRSNTKQINKQLWMSEGLSGVNDATRGETDICKMASSVCKYLAKYLRAQILTFYKAEEGKLRLIGSYAFNKQKNLRDTIDIGEGFVGQAALERETISITDVPRDYSRINSSIGDSYPRNIVVSPFVVEDTVYGVIEIGSFEELSDDKLELLKLIREPVGTIIRSIIEQGKTKELLEETQRQAEELQSQQEELEASNENLKKHTQLLKQSEEELKHQSEELKSANEELEEQTSNLKRSEEHLQAQQEELKASNEELEAKATTLKEQKNMLDEKNREAEEARTEIAQKAEDLELANKYKSEFLSSMSHELRTPLNSLLILAKLLQDNKSKNLTKKQVEFAKTIHQSGNDLLTLINDILDLSKVEAGKLEVNWEEINLSSWINNLEKTFSHVANKKELGFSVTISDNVPDIINSDSTRVAQILKNLLSNAFKFTAKGEVSLIIEKPINGNGIRFINDNLTADRTIAFKISDTGIGLSEEKQKIIFEAFQQADSRTSRKYGGTGLGLSISRELAKLLGGELHLKSEEGSGSTFTLFLPICHPEAGVITGEGKEEEVSDSDVAPDKEVVSTELDNVVQRKVDSIRDDRRELKPGDKSVLMVDDDPGFLEILSQLAHEKGFKTLVAGDGHTGLHMADYYRPSAIILDIKMPELNGFDVMKRLKENPKTRYIPVHFISGVDRTADALEAGAIGLLMKPVSAEDIGHCFEKFESLIETSIKSVLIVEDDTKQQKSLIALLEEKDVTSTAIETGEEAVELLKKDKFDCVILDLGLAGKMTGFELADMINNNDTIPRPPIIIYTGRDLSSEEEERLKQCSDGIIIKGESSPDRLKDEVNLFLHKVEEELPEQHKNALKAMYSKDESLDGKKVLIVDDDMRNVFALSSAIQDQGMSVIIGKNGREGIDQLEANPDINIILMDIMMPEMDGYEAMREIRRKEKFKDMPVIALTAKAMKGEKDRCTEAGASDYLSKPVDTERLLSLIRVWVHQQ